MDEICGNGIDDDFDGLVDKNDPDCEICGDGFLDPQEQCDDGNVMDGDGCSAVCQFENQNQPPVAQCQDVSALADENCQAPASVDNASFDPDGPGDIALLIQSPGGLYGLGVTDVTLTVTDLASESDVCTATVTVVDQTDPSLTCPGGPVARVQRRWCGRDLRRHRHRQLQRRHPDLRRGVWFRLRPGHDHGDLQCGGRERQHRLVQLEDHGPRHHPPTVSCVESVNPSGKNVPKARNVNEDGFYRITGADACASPPIAIGGHTLARGETIKITQARGKSGVRLVNTMGPLQIKHFQVGPGDAMITADDGNGNVTSATCLVPPPPK